MSREVHVRFCERPEVKFLRPTHPYIPTWAGFLYLAVVLDTFSRRIVGWSMATTLAKQLVLDALNMALVTRRPRDVIHHSDQGSQPGFNQSSQRSC
jgi:putative transposase